MSEESQRQPDPLIGETVGEYRVESRLGSGGMGIVYRATHSVIGKAVAIKILRTDGDPEHTQRLLAEARTVSQLRHRGIADIFGFGSLPDGRAYIVMELLEGKALDALLRERGTLGVPETLWIIEEALGPMAAAHSRGVIHRDIKPSNFFIAEDSEGSRYLKILDFGLAKRRAASENLTAVGSVLGTPDYMSPEQAQARPVTAASDIYSLGATAYELLTGSPPFDGASPMEIMVQHVRTPAPRASAKANGVPSEVDDLIASMLEKEPEKRPGSAAELKTKVTRMRRQMAREGTSEFDLPLPAPRRSAQRSKPVPAPKTEPTVISPPPQPSAEEAVTAPQAPMQVRSAALPGPPPPSNAKWFALGGVGILGILAGIAFLLLAPNGNTIPPKPPDPDPLTDGKPEDPPYVLVPPVPEVPDAGSPDEPGSADAGAIPQVAVAVDAGTQDRKAKAQVIKKKQVVDSSVEGRIKRNEAELRSREKAGQADPIASALLKSLKDELQKNPSAKDRIARDLKEWERRYLR